MDKPALTKEVAEQLSNLQDEINKKTLEYNILARRYNFDVMLDGRDPEAWLPSQLCW